MDKRRPYLSSHQHSGCTLYDRSSDGRALKENLGIYHHRIKVSGILDKGGEADFPQEALWQGSGILLQSLKA